MQEELVMVGVSWGWYELEAGLAASAGPWGFWGPEMEDCAHPGCVAMTLVSMVPGTQPSPYSGEGTESDRS